MGLLMMTFGDKSIPSFANVMIQSASYPTMTFNNKHKHLKLHNQLMRNIFNVFKI